MLAMRGSSFSMMVSVMEAVAEYDYPVVFDAPFGHLGDSNLALPLGIKMHLSASNSEKNRIFAL